MNFFWLIIKVILFRESFPISKASRIITYIRICIKQRLFRLLRKHPTHEHIFGLSISLGDYASFLSLYEEIFMGMEYYFTSPTQAPIILDAGSNIGMAMLFFKKLYPQATITCFEPSGSSFACLQRNITDNGLHNVTAFQYALDSTADREIQLFSSVETSLMTSVLRERNSSDVIVENVPTATLSSYIKGPVELMKIDIEGNEHAVMEDLRLNDRLKSVRQALIEYHHHISPDDDNLASFLGVLEEQGFHYQIHASFRPPFKRDRFQDMMIYAYR
ncbi:MAG: FkbM family methyltransferase [Candidatus Kapaibacterium sp.]